MRKKKIEKKIWKKIFQKKNFQFFFFLFNFFFSNFHIIRDSGFSLRYAKVRLSFPKKYNWKASFDIHLKWLLGADLKILFTFSNPSLKSVLQWLRPIMQHSSTEICVVWFLSLIEWQLELTISPNVNIEYS